MRITTYSLRLWFSPILSVCIAAFESPLRFNWWSELLSQLFSPYTAIVNQRCTTLIKIQICYFCLLEVILSRKDDISKQKNKNLIPTQCQRKVYKLTHFDQWQVVVFIHLHTALHGQKSWVPLYFFILYITRKLGILSNSNELESQYLVWAPSCFNTAWTLLDELSVISLSSLQE